MLVRYSASLFAALFMNMVSANPKTTENKENDLTEQQTIHLVDKQIAAYNARDIDAFAATYHDDAEIYVYPNQLLLKGKTALIERYKQTFTALTMLRATSVQRIVKGNYLVDLERAESSTHPSQEVTRRVELIATYEIEDGLIKRVTFKR
ncbi:nuclear transport factor 2 family protein [Pseudoalteromonas xiamenensis]|uniref:nuclear transport factor 2 family protein n=1 Tax=Pseudoalteromonas xiamenensis TaxID=882626 RepID=UPI0027E3B30B|nr:nuclear transport factor 2 family protein [Pseudoalteromonas xiamenensis]WMN60658.1 nuclear transport factor 2 family protein [Pseudoalteromonas xiamenensis]WMN60756.1 nuclear transport factor 2 family protein [Pseudoalteromonas xiamenensis]